jgi:phosphate starvation-inducible PhoH-like protein
MQNATKTQLKMALTRIGENSKTVVTADPKQCDLEDINTSAFNDFRLFKNTRGIGFVEFAAEDVVRSEVVIKVLNCYAKDAHTRPSGPTR